MKKWSKENLEGEALYESMRVLSDADRKEMYYKGRKPEYVTMSRRPGLGAKWFENYKAELYSSGFVVLPSGKRTSIPKFYDSMFSVDNPFEMCLIKGERLVRAQEDPDNTRARLQVRKEVQELRSKVFLNRGFEND